MSTVSELIEGAFAKLRERPGFVERPDQRQLALLLSDMIEGPSTGAIEAPTGLGKSLAALIPAIAQAIVSGKASSHPVTAHDITSRARGRSAR